MKDSIILFLFLIPTFLFAQYPTGSNKSRLGWQTTGDGLIWRGVASDTVNKPNNRNYPYFQLDTVNSVLYRYIQTQGQWQPVSESVNIDSLIYATRFWVNSNFFPLQGGTLTGTGGNGFVGFPLQSSPPSTPATGFSLFAGSTGNNISWMQPDGFFRRLVSPVTGTPRQYQFMARSYTLADSADVAALPTGTGTTNYYAKWSSTNALTIGNLFDNNTAVSILNSKPFQLGQWTTAGRPSGVNGYAGFNTTFNWPEWYSSSSWFSPLQSSLTGGLGTAGRLLFTDANGRATDSGNITWNETTGKQLSIISNSTGLRGVLVRQTTNDIIGIGYNTQRIRGSSAVQNGDFIGVNSFSGFDGSSYSVDAAYFGGQVTGAVSTGIVPTSIIFTAGSGTSYVPSLLVHHSTNVGIGNFGNAASGTIVAPAEKLEVRGNIRNDGVVNSIITAVNSPRFSTIQNYNNGTMSRTGYFTITGASSGANSVFAGFQAFPPAFTDAVWGGTYIAASSLFTSIARKGASNSYMHFATGSDQSLVDTAEFVFHRTPTNLALSNTTRIAAITNRGIQFPGTTTAGRVLSKVNQYWISYNTDSTAFNYRDNTGWHLFATRAYARSLVAGLPTTWLKTELEAGRDVNIAGVASTDFRIQNTRIQFDGKFKSGSDSSFVHDPTQDTTYIKGDTRIQSGNLTIEKTSGTPYLNIIAKAGSGNQEAGIYLKSRANFSPIIEFDNAAVAGTAGRQLAFYNYNTDAGGKQVFIIGGGLGRFGARNIGQFTVFDSLNTTQRFSFNSGGIATFDLYGGPATTAAALSKTLSNYGVGFATDGTVTSREIKRDTTIYVTDADYNFAAAITSAQILARHNRIIIYSKLSSGATSDNQIFLHTPSADFLQCEIIIYSNDASADSDATSIDFTVNGAVDGAGGTLSSYAMAPGQRVEIRVADDGGYKWFFN